MIKQVLNIKDISARELNNLELIIFDFDGVFTDNTVYTDEFGNESVRCSRSDGLGISRLREVGVKACIISTEENPVVSARANKLKVRCYQKIPDKAITVRSVCREFEVEIENTMFVGNDINDVAALEIVGVSVGVADSFAEILPYLSYLTKRQGGDGAVREICDIVYQRKSRETLVGEL